MKPAEESIRILKKIDVVFPNGKTAYGSGFVGNNSNEIITCNHVICSNGQVASSIKVNGVNATLKERYSDIDIAILDWKTSETSNIKITDLPSVGESVYFSGYPTGVKSASVFYGIISAFGANLISNPSCEVFQINGMINSGNSGGPLLDTEGNVIGLVTAKHVPLLQEVDKLRSTLKSIPQFPSSVGIGGIDFSKFVNMMMQSLSIISGTLRLVQVGTGYAVPLKLLNERRQ